jgi:outer membrane protein assembly factor BamB
LLWKFDANPKESVWEGNGQGDRANIISTPVVSDGRVYVVMGHDPEFGEADGRVWCIDPTKRGDVSPTLVFDKQGKPAPPGGTRSVASGQVSGHDGAWPSAAPRRTQAADPAAGDVVKANPNSAAIWEYTGHDANGDGEMAFEERMHRALGMVAIKNDILVVADLAGLVHCLDAKTGRPHWTHDMMATVWSSPLVVDGKVYLGDEDGDMAVFELSAKKNLLAENSMGDSVYSAAVVAGNTLFIATRTRLLAIAAEGQ